MRYKLNYTCFLFVVLISFLQAQEINFTPNEFIVQFADDKSYVNFIGSNSSLRREQVEVLSKSLNIVLIKEVDETIKIENELKKFNINSIQRNHFIEFREEPNDSLFNLQWALFNDGSGGKGDADVDAELAWISSVGGETVLGDTIVVAVIDEGFDLEHEDLDYYVNYNEIPANLIDDDNNGFIDDYKGWNANNSNGVITVDDHGTHIAGIIGAKGNNEIGITGVNQKMKIYPIQIAVNNPQTLESRVIKAYGHIIDVKKQYLNTNGQEGAYIVATNSSFGVNLAKPDEYPIWCALYDSLGAYGILNAVAGPNSNYNIDEQGDIPGTCESEFMICAASTNFNDGKENSGYGPINVDLGAPGKNIISTVPDNNYKYKSGTSMASPHVAGAIGLLHAVACDSLIEIGRKYPDSLATLMKEFIMSSTDSIDELSGITVTGGRLNINGATQKLIEMCTNNYNGVGEIDHALAIEVFPNPASSYVVIKNNSYSKMLNLEIISILGEVVYSQGLDMHENYVDIQNLEYGSYIFRITDKDTRKIAIRKVVLTN